MSVISARQSRANTPSGGGGDAGYNHKNFTTPLSSIAAAPSPPTRTTMAKLGRSHSALTARDVSSLPRRVTTRPRQDNCVSGGQSGNFGNRSAQGFRSTR